MTVSTPVSVPELLRLRAQAQGDSVAVTFEGASVTYAELESRSASVQTWLQERGVGKGDKVAIFMVNSLEFLYAWFGVARAGAVGVPVNTSSMGEGLRYTLWHSDSCGIIADRDLLVTVDEVDPVEALTWRVSVGGDHPDTVPFAELLSAAPASEFVALEAADPMNIIYTSGTTGMPKGVILSHFSYVNTGAYFAEHLGLTSEDILHTCLPLFHCNAQQTTLMSGLHLGAKVVLNGKFSLSNFWRWIEESEATVTNLLGAMLVLLAKLPENEGEANNPLRYIVCAPIPEALHRPLEKRYGVRLVEGYGLTETGTMACINPPDATEPGTFGLPLTHNELRIVDENDEDVPDGTPGQIITRTHLANAYMSGYYKEPEKTAEAMAGGWFHTGDAGYRRPDGYFVFLDRIKDTIRRRGENISSFFIEKVVGDHAQVQEVAAVGVPSELSEDDVAIFCVLQPGATLTESELSDWCGTKLGDFMRPRYIVFRESFPRTETGRVQKFALRADGVVGAWDREASQSRSTT
ncbi:MAG: AMP-binding protein [Planctomycetota bacterium]